LNRLALTKKVFKPVVFDLTLSSLRFTALFIYLITAKVNKGVYFHSLYQAESKTSCSP